MKSLIVIETVTFCCRLDVSSIFGSSVFCFLSTAVVSFALTLTDKGGAFVFIDKIRIVDKPAMLTLLKLTNCMNSTACTACYFITCNPACGCGTKCKVFS